MKNYKIVLRLDNFESPILEIEAENWEMLCDYVFGRIEIIDTEETEEEEK